jgi:rhodanese-related sulfurtransferase/SAM-dependent methyltransferase
MSTWSTVDADAYDSRWAAMEAAGQSIHGEVDFLCELLDRYQIGHRVLDAGCGTGRVAIELATRGFDVVGADLDDTMLGVARANAPGLSWVTSDLAALQLDCTFDAVILAGNVIGFVDREHRAKALRRCVEHVRIGGLIVSGFSLSFPGLTAQTFNDLMLSEGVELVGRFSTWAGAPCSDNDDYLVSVYRRTTMQRRTNIHDLLAVSRDHPSLTVDELRTALAYDDAIVIDTRTPSDRRVLGHIPGSIHAPRTVMEWRVDPASGYQDERICGFDQFLVVVCNEGYSSSVAAASLRRLGFHRARDLSGGMAAWIAANQEVHFTADDDELLIGLGVRGVPNCMGKSPGQ